MNKPIKLDTITLEPQFQLGYEFCEYYWVSFSLDGANQGCCTIKANSEKKAIDKATKLHKKIKYDDILALPVPYDITELDKLISGKELLKIPGFSEINF